MRMGFIPKSCDISLPEVKAEHLFPFYLLPCVVPRDITNFNVSRRSPKVKFLYKFVIQEGPYA